jgi:hypothetical protein
MSLISVEKFSKGWDQFFFSEVSSKKLGFYRILIGFFLSLNAASYLVDWKVWFSINDGVIPMSNSFLFYSDPRINLFKIFAMTDSVVLIVLWTYFISSLMVLVGFKSRIATIISFITLVTLQNRNYAILNSGDTLMRCMLFVMMFAPSGNSFSIDRWLKIKNGETVNETMSAWPLRLLQIQFAIVYWATTLFKMKGFDWVDGTATYYTARLENFQRLPLPFLFDSPFMVKFTTWGALFIEFALGILIWVKELKYWVLLSGILLHLGIEITMSIGFFEWIMMGTYVLFLEENHFNAGIDWIQRKFKLKSQPA